MSAFPKTSSFTTIQLNKKDFLRIAKAHGLDPPIRKDGQKLLLREAQLIIQLKED